MHKTNRHRLRRKIVAVLTPLCLLMAATPAWSLTQARVNVSVANIRSGPGTSYNLAGQAAQGAIMEVVEKKTDWVKVKIPSGGTGWVSDKLVGLKEITAVPAAEKTAFSGAEITGSIVNVRSGPGAGSSVLGQLKQGFTARILERSGDWYKLQLASGPGWVFGELLRVNPPAPQPAAGGGGGAVQNPGTVAQNIGADTSGNGVINGVSVNIRSGPGTGYGIMTMASRGQRLPLVSRSQDWYQVRTTDNKTGWVAAWLVDVGASAPAGTGSEPQEDNASQAGGGGSGSADNFAGETGGQMPGDGQISGAGGEDPGQGQQPESAEVVKTTIGQEAKNTIISIEYSGQLTDYKLFRLKSPDRLVVDLEGARPDRPKEMEIKGAGLVRQAKMSWYGRDPDVTRLVMELKDSCSYITQRENGKITVKLFPPGPGVPLRGSTLVLDPGHGGSDPGAIGTGGLLEKDITLDLTKRTAALLKDKGARVLLTRSDDTYVDLDQRPEVANKANAQLFLSIHINANNNRSAGGTSTYFMRNLPGSQERLQVEGESLANYLQENLVDELGRRDIGVLQANFAVLRMSQVPAALVEVVFISNPQEEALLQKEKFKDKVAQALARGVQEYFEGN